MVLRPLRCCSLSLPTHPHYSHSPPLPPPPHCPPHSHQTHSTHITHHICITHAHIRHTYILHSRKLSQVKTFHQFCSVTTINERFLSIKGWSTHFSHKFLHEMLHFLPIREIGFHPRKFLAVSISYVTSVRYVAGINHEARGRVAPRGPNDLFRQRTERT